MQCARHHAIRTHPRTSTFVVSGCYFPALRREQVLFPRFVAIARGKSRTYGCQDLHSSREPGPNHPAGMRRPRRLQVRPSAVQIWSTARLGLAWQQAKVNSGQ
jgi:hypothetical protein